MIVKKQKGLKASEYIFGIHPVMEAVKADQSIDRILIKKGMNNDKIREITGVARAKSIYIQYVPIEKLNSITQKLHQGIIALKSLIEYQDIEKIVPFLFEQGKIPSLLILDGITDVRNFGSIARSCECAGSDAVIIPASGAARINSDAVKTSAGALNRIAVCRVTSLTETVQFLKNSGIQIFAATEKAENLIYDRNLTLPGAILLGGEDTGISEPLLSMADTQMKIPLMGKIGSLNVAVASGVIMFEMLRQRENSNSGV